ncbi:DUF3696 domain-containing protein [Desulfobacterales bacterium HSG2]|nr:DUF3696 domain-containing protein [Desulfobacterales bacterium HSG2]
MIQTWTIQNFKSVSDKTTLSMKPLTIFAGANSSGKSTLIQSILLVAQTLQTTVGSRSVVLNGHILRLGSFDDIVFNHQSDQTVLIGFGLTPIIEDGLEIRYLREERENTENALRKKEKTGIILREKEKIVPDIIGCDFAFSSKYSSEKKDIRQSQPVLEESNISFEKEESKAIFSAQKIHGSINKKLEKFYLKDNRLRKAEMNSLQYEITAARRYSVRSESQKLNDKTVKVNVNKGIAGASFSHFLPKAIVEIYQEFVGEEGQIGSLLESISPDLSDFEAISVKKSSLSFTPLPNIVNFAVENIQSYFTEHLKYLGPLREEPKPIYPLSGTMDSKDVGIRGEHTASVLNIHSNTRIEYIPSEHFAADEPNPCSKSSTLSDAVLDWLDYMGVSNVKTANIGNIGVELKVSLDNAFWHNLVHVGIGVSQVLPIVVSALLAEKGTTLIFEQPELHLHPRVQTRLADFFLSMTILKKQCVVETHSEYLINRLRYRSVMAEGTRVSDEVVIFFVERKDGRSAYREIKINKFGVKSDWPKGFFDENEENASKLIKAAMEKRKRESGKRNA